MSCQPMDPADQARFDAIPALGSFAETVLRVVTDDPESFWGCEEALRALAGNQSFVADLVNYELTRLRRDPSYVARESTESRIALLIHPNVELGLVHVEPREDVAPSGLSTIGDHVMIGSLGPGTLRLEAMKHSTPVTADIFDPTRALDVAAELQVAPGDVRLFHAGIDAVVERSPIGPACMLLFIYRGATRVRWLFDGTSRLPTRVVSSDHQTYRMDFAARILARMGYEPAAPTLEDLFSHPAHFVRWAAARELMLLDPERGMKLIERATEDPHPHVRNAAKRSLEKLQPARAENPVTAPGDRA